MQDEFVNSTQRAQEGSWLASLFKVAPWWMISASITLVALGITSLVYFGEEKKKEKLKALEAEISVATQKIETPIEEKQIEAEPIPINDPTDADPTDNAEPEVFMPNAMISDHNETDNDEDFEQMKGDTKDSNVHFDSSGKNMFDSIGLGAGSGVGRGRYGGAFGGRRNLVARKGRPGGATEKTQLAVMDGLKWLARHQSSDGSWQPANFPSNCGSGSTCDGTGAEHHTVGSTGLALLAFLGAGFNHQSTDRWVDPVTQKNILVKDVIRNGLKYLVDQQSEDGSLGPMYDAFFYNHSIATLALCEAFGLSKNAYIKEPAQTALDFLIRNQTPSPGGTGFLGWRYKPGDGQSDTSSTGWCVMALKSAEISGLQISQGSYDGALTFVRGVTAPDFKVGYRDRSDAGQFLNIPGINDDYMNHQAMTAVGMLIRTFVEHDLNDPALEKGAEILVKDLPVWDKNSRKGPVGFDGKPNDYYYWYYGSLALNQFDGPDSPRKDGKFWKEWNEALVKALIPNQRKDTCFAGSWDGDDRWGHSAGRIYATAINTLTLEVYYRYDNAFGSSKRGGKAAGSSSSVKVSEGGK